jgi:uncharacterized protein (DUF2384 family)
MNTDHESLKRKAAEVFGGYDQAEFWLTSPLRELECRTPSDLFSTAEGRQAVFEMLERIDDSLFY